MPSVDLTTSQYNSDMKCVIVAVLIAVAAASTEYPVYPKPSYPAPAYSKPTYPAPAYSKPEYPAPSYSKPEYPAYPKTYDYAPMPYNLAYAVKDEPSYNDYSHSESSDGKTVTGSYRVVLPDTRTQVVNYKADDYGYVADVKYEGEAKYDAYKSAYPANSKSAYPAPAYPKPAYPEPAYPKPSYPAPAYPKPSY